MNYNNYWQLLVVDDDIDCCQQVREFLEGEKVICGSEKSLHVVTLTSFDEALNEIEKRRFDLLILDVRVGSYEHTCRSEEEEGIKTLEAIRKRRFLPVVFYTNLPLAVGNLENPVIRVVKKTDGLSQLLVTIKEMFDTRLPDINRALIRHLERIQRDYMWDFVVSHWKQFGDNPGPELVFLLARRLALSLSGQGIQELAQDLGITSVVVNTQKVQPVEYYVIPPVENKPLAGDLYQGDIGERSGYWVLLTPTCDIWQDKSEWVLLAYCELLVNQSEYKEWAEALPGASNRKRDKIEKLFKNNRQNHQAERYFYLPGVFNLPHLIVDFQQLITIPRHELDKLERIASLDSP